MRNILFICLLLAGCVDVAPNLKIPEECSKQVMYMPPIPENVSIIIHGDRITADQGGEELLRYYVLARKRLSPQ